MEANCDDVLVSTNVNKNKGNFLEESTSLFRKELSMGFCNDCNTEVHLLKVHQAVQHENRDEFRCLICGLPCLTSSHLVKHLSRHSSSDTFCFYCGDDNFTDSYQLLHHLEEHKCLHVYFCQSCDESFATKDEYDLHSQVHIKYRRCTDCNALYESTRKGMRTLRKHYLSSHSKIFKCRFCRKVFNKFVSFYNHCMRHLNLLPYSCYECGVGFSKQCRLIDHVQTVHENKHNFHCSQCDQSFKHQSAYDAHLRLHDVTLQFSCDYCHKFFVRKHRLKYHFVDKECDDCGVQLKCRTVFDQHFLKKHRSERWFQCESCSKSYFLESALKRHRTIEHPSGKENCYMCRLCPYTTITLHNLNRHSRRNHASLR